MKKAVIFDLDGTLADTIEDLAGSVNKSLRERVYPEHDFAEYKLMVGEGFRLLVERALPESARKAELIDEIAAEASAYYAERCLDMTRAYPEAPRLLESLAERGIAMAVLSNKPDGLTRKVVESLFPGAPFRVVRGETEEFPRKPDPASALDIASRLGAPCGETLYLGDSAVDMRTAAAAGFMAIGAAWGFRGEAELRAAGADAIIARPLDLLEFL